MAAATSIVSRGFVRLKVYAELIEGDAAERRYLV